VFVGKDAHSAALFGEVLELCEQGYSFSELLQAGQALSHLMALLVRRAREPHTESADTDLRIDQSVAFLELHCERDIDLKKLARLAGLSPSRYSALFKSRTGHSPMNYLTRLRMHRAAGLLETTNESVKSISATVGYRDQLYFSRVFRAVHNVAPSDYRKRLKS
jgi:AraC-like DNA-binding protein